MRGRCAIDAIERLAVEKLFDRESGEPPVMRIYTPNSESGTHQMIFRDRVVYWELALETAQWSLLLETLAYDFRCSPANIAELRVRLKPGVQLWLRTPDNEWVAEIFRWSDFHPGEPFAAFIPEAWRANNPPKMPPA